MGKKSQTTTKKTIYGNTTTSNPYAYAKTNNKGTVSGFQNGTALNSIYDFVNNSIDSLLDEYLNPKLDSAANQAKLNSFVNSMAGQTQANLENDIIRPLSDRNMIRSSQATDLYKNLSNQNVAAISNYISNLLSSSQDNTAKMLSNLLSYYMLGADYLSDMQNQSLRTSQGNASQTYTSGGSSNSTEMIAKLVSNLINTIAT